MWIIYRRSNSDFSAEKSFQVTLLLRFYTNFDDISYRWALSVCLMCWISHFSSSYNRQQRIWSILPDNCKFFTNTTCVHYALLRVQETVKIVLKKMWRIFWFLYLERGCRGTARRRNTLMSLRIWSQSVLISKPERTLNLCACVKWAV